MNAYQIQQYITTQLSGKRVERRWPWRYTAEFLHTYDIPPLQLRVIFSTNTDKELVATMATFSNGANIVFDQTQPIGPQLNRLAITALLQ